MWLLTKVNIHINCCLRISLSQRPLHFKLILPKTLYTMYLSMYQSHFPPQYSSILALIPHNQWIKRQSSSKGLWNPTWLACSYLFEFIKHCSLCLYWQDSHNDFPGATQAHPSCSSHCMCRPHMLFLCLECSRRHSHGLISQSPSLYKKITTFSASLCLAPAPEITIPTYSLSSLTRFFSFVLTAT